MSNSYIPKSSLLFAGDLYAEKGKHRLFEPLFDIILAFLATYRAIEVARGSFRQWSEEEWGTLSCLLFPHLSISIPAYNVLERAVAGHRIDYIRLYLLCYPEESEETQFTTSVFSNFHNNLTTAYFVQFFDPWIEWIKDNISTDYHNWPEISNFARVVRNAATHGGTINIKGATAPTVSWYTLSYGHKNYGRSVFGVDLSCADLILLMFEVSNELDKLGAPLTLS